MNPLCIKRVGHVVFTAFVFCMRTTCATGSASGLRQNQFIRHRRDSDKDAFTVIFFSDLENRYRNHKPERSRYVLEYITNLRERNMFYDDAYSNVTIDPALAIHGGDNYHMLGCEEKRICRTLLKEWHEVWEVPFRAHMPLISGFGNHDWLNRKGTGNTSLVMWGNGDESPGKTTDIINEKAQKFVSQTFKKAARVDSNFRYQEFPATGSIGPSFYRATFLGVQIASFNCAVNWESYDDNRVYSSDQQFQNLASSLDRNMTTIFFEHYPISFLPGQTRAKLIALIQEFPTAIHMSGHIHVPAIYDYEANGPQAYGFQDYVAPYPHSWPTDCSNCRDPGFYAMLVSPTDGILQVKQMSIPGLQDGESCNKHHTCKLCHSGYEYWPSARKYKCGREPKMSGSSCVAFFTCDDQCGSAGYQCPWYGFFVFLCNCK